MSFLESNLTMHYNCSTKPCDPNILAAIQWTSSGVTHDLPDIFNKLKYERWSVKDWNPNVFNFTPEWYAYSRIRFKDEYQPINLE